MTFRADLHCHSNCSDGSDTPMELLEEAKRRGLQGLSITDHDTIDAYTPELLQKAEEVGIRLLPGIELSSELQGTTLHILGYGFDLHAVSLNHFLQGMQRRRAVRNRAILEKLSEKGMAIDEEELLSSAHKSVGRPHIAALMVQKGYVESPQKAFEFYLREGGACYVSGFKSSPEEVVLQIHEAGGMAVLAHPHFLKKRSLIQKALILKLDGIECYYANLSARDEAPWLKIAKERNLIATGGSDYHGKVKPTIQLGASWVDEETFNRLLSARSREKRETGDG